MSIGVRMERMRRRAEEARMGLIILRHLHEHLFQVHLRAVEVRHRDIAQQQLFKQLRRRLLVAVKIHAKQLRVGKLNARNAGKLLEDRRRRVHLIAEQPDIQRRAAVHLAGQRVHRAREHQIAVINDGQ